jgi:hypothetical protein
MFSIVHRLWEAVGHQLQCIKQQNASKSHLFTAIDFAMLWVSFINAMMLGVI